MKIFIIKTERLKSQNSFSNMKGTIIGLTIVFFSAVALGGRLYGEKEDLIQEVNSKYDEVITFSKSVGQEIEAETKKSEQQAANDAKASVQEKSKIVKQKFEKDIIEVARSAVARGKPLSSIECIIKVAIEGRQLIVDTLKEHEKAVDAVQENRIKELEVEKMHTELIKTATEGLKEESLTKMNQEKNINNLKTLKNDAIKKANTACKQLKDIETRILKPVLKERYKNLRNANEAKYNEIKESLLKRLQKCIA